MAGDRPKPRVVILFYQRCCGSWTSEWTTNPCKKQNGLLCVAEAGKGIDDPDTDLVGCLNDGDDHIKRNKQAAFAPAIQSYPNNLTSE
ncbi:MAG: hypothetical protein NT105_11845 [Verrucomicrobia bacterium]|nr:hypothetical protein [Verrucomicrobiota bacterium]